MLALLLLSTVAFSAKVELNTVISNAFWTYENPLTRAEAIAHGFKKITTCDDYPDIGEVFYCPTCTYKPKVQALPKMITNPNLPSVTPFRTKKKWSSSPSAALAYTKKGQFAGYILTISTDVVPLGSDPAWTYADDEMSLYGVPVLTRDPGDACRDDFESDEKIGNQVYLLHDRDSGLETVKVPMRENYHELHELGYVQHICVDFMGTHWVRKDMDKYVKDSNKGFPGFQLIYRNRVFIGLNNVFWFGKNVRNIGKIPKDYDFPVPFSDYRGIDISLDGDLPFERMSITNEYFTLQHVYFNAQTEQFYCKRQNPKSTEKPFDFLPYPLAKIRKEREARLDAITPLRKETMWESVTNAVSRALGLETQVGDERVTVTCEEETVGRGRRKPVVNKVKTAPKPVVSVAKTKPVVIRD